MFVFIGHTIIFEDLYRRLAAYQPETELPLPFVPCLATLWFISHFSWCGNPHICLTSHWIISPNGMESSSHLPQNNKLILVEEQQTSQTFRQLGINHQTLGCLLFYWHSWKCSPRYFEWAINLTYCISKRIDIWDSSGAADGDLKQERVRFWTIHLQEVPRIDRWYTFIFKYIQLLVVKKFSPKAQAPVLGPSYHIYHNSVMILHLIPKSGCCGRMHRISTLC